jgi:hypothetical protein
VRGFPDESTVIEEDGEMTESIETSDAMFAAAQRD